MRCVCVDHGQVRLAKSGKIIWVEPGQEHDIQVVGDAVPSHMKPVTEKPAEAEKSAEKPVAREKKERPPRKPRELKEDDL